ncbi:TPA: hypothetical protein EYP26_02070 [Candidatus Bathyarchaeota archaeon]|nr:hypothetical protein [Candidatus Bathyarchaeota archaeon]
MASLSRSTPGFEKILSHYSDPLVQSEISHFCKGRWVGIHCEALDARGRKILIRYFRPGMPLQLAKPRDVKRLILKFSSLKPRTIYATANVYGRLGRSEDAADPSNVEACSPTWDVDNEPGGWLATAQAVKEITSVLKSSGVKDSFFVKFSGRGAHVHIHPYAISEEVRVKFGPLNLAWATVEYVKGKAASKLAEIAARFKAGGLRVDNEIDRQRLFVAPLSIHREENRVAVCLNPEELGEFDPAADAKPGRFKHFEGWKAYSVGEADKLALRAYRAVGGLTLKPRRKRRHPPLDKQILSLIARIDRPNGRASQP